jgi:hypothetical protein
MGCNCGYPNPGGAVYCLVCGARIAVRQQDKHAASMFAVPDFVLYIYTVGQRKRLFKGVRFLTLFILALVLLSFNMLAFVLTPLYVYWLYFFHNFKRSWKAYSYSKTVINAYMVCVIVMSFMFAPQIRGLVTWLVLGLF